MFKINYRITDSIDELNNLSECEITQGAHVEGYFEIIVNNKSTSYCNTGILHPGEEGMELITTWFEGLLETLIALKNQYTYVVLSDIDSYNTWLEFKTINHNIISISKVHAEKKDGSRQVETEPPANIMYTELANEIISCDELYNEVINKTDEYLQEIIKINPRLADGRRMTELKNLMLKLKTMQ